MFHRAIVVAIVAFWLLMSTLLVRTQLSESQGELQPVPVDFVCRLMFEHEQPAYLVLYTQHRRLDGYLQLQPKHLPHGEDGKSAALDLLSGSGSFALALPGVDPQRVTFRGVLELDGHRHVRRLDLTANVHQTGQTGQGMTLQLAGRPAQDDWHYTVKEAGTVLREDSGTIASLLAAADPHLPGLRLDAIQQLERQQAADTRYSAHRGTLRLGGEAIDSYVVAVEHGGALKTDVYFDQLGQVLAVKTFTGYDLFDEKLAP